MFIVKNFFLFVFIVSVSSKPTTDVTGEDSSSMTPTTNMGHSMVPVATEETIDVSMIAKEETESKRVPKASGAGEDMPQADEPKNEEENEHQPLQLPANQILVETNNGDVIGFKQNVLGKEVFTFLGIPYAKPPIGELRFKRPEIVRPWRRPYKALQWSAICEQTLPENFSLPVKRTTHKMSEDCLYLNIWTTNVDKNKPKPVMIWFHGGFFSFGSANNEENDGKMLSAFGDVVVVSFNYRLSAYGFLNLDIPDAKGNMGLFDQNLALKWVHANIDQFGGDKDLITAFGQGVGAFSIGIHVASPLSRDLFKRAIMQSGSPVYLNFVFETQLNSSEKLADAVGCNNEDGDIALTEPTEALNCIKSQPKRSLREAIGEVLQSYPLAYLPSFGDKLMPVSSLQTFADPSYYYDQQKEIMIGMNNDDGSLYLNFVFPEKFSSKSEPKEFTQEEMKDIFNDLVENKWPVPESYKKLTADFDPDNITTQSLYRIFSDNMVTCPVVSFASNFAQIPDKSVYFYKFNHRSSNNPFSKWIGVNTFEEVQYIFGVPLSNEKSYTPEEIELSKQMMNTWVSFAKTGKPEKLFDKEWPKYDPINSNEHLVINEKSVDIDSGIDKKCQLFNFALNADSE